jgi:hypothetical protein
MKKRLQFFTCGMATMVIWSAAFILFGTERLSGWSGMALMVNSEPSLEQ